MVEKIHLGNNHYEVKIAVSAGLFGGNVALLGVAPRRGNVLVRGGKSRQRVIHEDQMIEFEAEVEPNGSITYKVIDTWKIVKE